MYMFRYKIAFAGLEEKKGEQKIIEVTTDMQKNWLDNTKDAFSGIFGGNKDKVAEEPAPLEFGKPDILDTLRKLNPE